LLRDHSPDQAEHATKGKANRSYDIHWIFHKEARGDLVWSFKLGGKLNSGRYPHINTGRAIGVVNQQSEPVAGRSYSLSRRARFARREIRIRDWLRR